MKIFSTLFLLSVMLFTACGAGRNTENDGNATVADEASASGSVDGSVSGSADASAEAVSGATQLPSTIAAPKESKVQYISEAEFKDLVFNYVESPEKFVYEGGAMPCIVDFYADWCGPCKRLAPILDDLSWEYRDKVKFYKVNTDKNREISGAFQIRSIPTLMYVNNKGELLGVQPGMPSREQLVQIINEYLTK